MRKNFALNKPRIMIGGGSYLGYVPPRHNEDKEGGSYGRLEMHLPFANYAGPYTDVKRRLREGVKGMSNTDTQAIQHDLDYYNTRVGLRNKKITKDEAIARARKSDIALRNVAIAERANPLTMINPIKKFHSGTVAAAMAAKMAAEDMKLKDPMDTIEGDEVPAEFKGAGKQSVLKKKMKEGSDGVLVMENKEKKNKYEEWDEGRDWANFPAVFRTVIMGVCNSGKSNTIKNLIAKANPEFKQIFIAHPQYWTNEDVENKDCIIAAESVDPIVEFDDVKISGVLRSIPDKKFWMKLMKNAKYPKTLLFFDDVDLISWAKGRTRKERLDKLFSYVSSHTGINIIVSCQDMSSQIPTYVIKNTTTAIIHRLRNLSQLIKVSQSIGINLKGMRLIFDKLCTDIHDFLVYQSDSLAPYRYSKNFYQKIPNDIDEFVNNNSVYAHKTNSNLAKKIMDEMNIVEGGGMAELKEVEDGLGDSITSNIELENYIMENDILADKFKGIYKDEPPKKLKKLLKNGGDFIIMNKDMHWTTIFRKENGEIFEWDSFGEDEWDDIPEFSNKKEQKDYELNCGQRVIAFLLEWIEGGMK